VDAAVLSVLPYYRTLVDGSYYRYDNSYGEEAAQRFPTKFCSVLRVDPADPDLETVLAEGMRGFGVVGMREVITSSDKVGRLRGGGYERLFKAAEDQDIPMMIVVQPELWAAAKAAREHPRLRLIVDHVGLVQPGMHLPPNANPLEDLPQVLALAKLPNIFLKISGIVTLSKEAFPFADLRVPLSQLLTTFGPERLIWGSDFHRTKPRTYLDAVDFLRYNHEVSDADKELIMGANLRRVLHWQRTSDQVS
jgi:L-fuconolactonase